MIVDGGICFGANYEYSYSRAIEVLPNGYIVSFITVLDDNESFTNYHGNVESWVFILNEEGDITNEICFGGSGEDWFVDIEIFNECIYFIGQTESTDGDVQSEPIGETANLWVVKTDFDLNIIWEKQYGCYGTLQFESAKVTHEGGLLLLSDFFGTNGGDVSEYFGNTDIWVCEIDASGEILWEKTLGNEYMNYASNLIVNSIDNIVVIGETTNSGGMIECNCQGGRDIWVTELDGDTQEIIWQNCYGGSLGDGSISIFEDESCYFIVGGTQSSDGDIESYNHGGGDAWVLQIDHSGQLLWERCFGGSNGEHIKNLFKTEDNSYLLFGITDSRDGDVNQTHCPYPNCQASTWVIELDSTKEMIWNGVHGSYAPSYHEKNGIKRIGDKDFIIAGIVRYDGTHLGDVDCEPYPINSGKSAWIYRFYDPDVGIIKRPQNFSLKTYPNPAQTQITFELPVIAKETSIIIKNVFGKTVEELPLINRQSQLIWDCRNVASGIYFYHTKIGEKTHSGKILKQ